MKKNKANKAKKLTLKDLKKNRGGGPKTVCAGFSGTLESVAAAGYGAEGATKFQDGMTKLYG